jgi:hypothetical protein
VDKVVASVKKATLFAVSIVTMVINHGKNVIKTMDRITMKDRTVSSFLEGTDGLACGFILSCAVFEL